jgi:putative membrane protein
MWGYGPDWGMMGGWGGYGWFGFLHMIVWLVILAAVVVGIVWLARGAIPRSDTPPGLPRRSSGLDVLEERYARGEINREEYLQKRRDILG